MSSKKIIKIRKKKNTNNVQMAVTALVIICP